MQCVLYYANIVHIDVNIISRAPLSPVGDIHRLSCTKMKKKKKDVAISSFKREFMLMLLFAYQQLTRKRPKSRI